MAEPYVGEIRWLAGDQVPATGWKLCDGQSLSGATDSGLFEAIGHSYGGQGDAFSLPDLRGRVPVQVGAGRALGRAGGQERVALTAAQMPAHTHVLGANSGDGDRADPAGSVWA